MKATYLWLLISVLAIAACEKMEGEGKLEQERVEEHPVDLSADIREDDLHTHVATLASDDFEGRAPFTAGEEKTLDYLEAQYRAFGLKPAAEDGSYRQAVPLVEITPEPASIKASIIHQDGEAQLDHIEDIVIWTKRVSGAIALERSDMVFVGYGINAPEYGWNDYAGVDVRGKTVVILINDPGFATGDPKLFNGKAMTYYGRWTYKYEEAARQGATAALIIHQTEPAAYPWGVVESSWTGAQLDLERDGAGSERVAIEGWLHERTARGLLQKAGLDLDEAHRRALSRDFQAVDLNQSFSAGLRNKIAHSQSYNMVGLVEGSSKPDEVVLYMAHWDHIGRGPADETGDDIYNGALDNATGVAGLLELAQKFSSAGEPPERSVLFMAVTAEEQGLLGSAHYAKEPIVAPEKTAAAINMDGLNVFGPMEDITIIGWKQNSLQALLVEAAQKQGRVVRPEPTPEHGYFYRSDHFNLAKIGIPVLYTDIGVTSREHGREWTARQRDAYVKNAYHQPGDEYDPDWDMSGAVEDLALFYDIGARLAYGDMWPQWSDRSEFKAARQSSKGTGE